MTKQQFQRKLQLRQGMIEFARDEYEATELAKECAELRREIRRMSTRETAALNKLSDAAWQDRVMPSWNRARTAYSLEGVE